MIRLRTCLTCLCALGLLFAATGITASARGEGPSGERSDRQPFFRLSWGSDRDNSLSPTMQGVIRSATGKITFLRVHELGTGYGPPSDFINVEVVIKLDSMPGKSFGFQLRRGTRYAANSAMLQIMRTAFEENADLTIDYIDLGLTNSVLLRALIVPSAAPVLQGYPVYIPCIQK